jgi:hypothetical protein
MRLFCAAAIVLLTACARKPSNPAAASTEHDFEQMMTGATLVGHSTSTGHGGLSAEERYAIDKVTKIGAETWLFQTRMHFEGHDFPLPVPVTIKWAGDTPVITLTDVSIPGLGTYTARVVLYRDQYAGTWSAQHGGGQIFGSIAH